MPDVSRPIRIAINAQFSPGSVGGVETAVTELIAALGRLSATDGGEEEYLIVGPANNPEWLRPFASGNQRIVSREGADFKQKDPPGLLQQAYEPLRPVLRQLRNTLQPSRGTRQRQFAEVGGGAFFEALEPDVVHFPYQAFSECRLPTIYNPHDLQHLHFPEFFTPQAIKKREATFRRGCRHSHTVVVGSDWIAKDVREQYRLPAKRVQVIQWAAPTCGETDFAEETLEAIKRKFGLERPFALYPAATWEHKNHLRLLEAAKHLRARDELSIDIVCTGEQMPHYERIQAQARRLGLEEKVRFLGRLPAEELRALYRLARFVFIPTLFEAASAPLFEAWRDGVPAACSHVTSLPQQAGNAALLFDPLSIEGMAEALSRMQSDDSLRKTLVVRGRKRLRAFSWDRTARAYRAVYRRAAGRRLSEEERHLLSSMNGTA